MNWREKWKKKWKYISNRVQVLGVLCLAALSVSGAVQLAAAKTGTDALFTTGCLTLLAGAALAASFGFWVVRPYREHEKVEKRFLAGYMFSEEDLERAVLTPTMREQMEMMEKIIRSPQLMDLNKRQAQYLALQNQINPHFLYNTLESIRGEALIAGLDGVADMTESLAKFFRYTITKVENLVSVEEELDNCETYFGIQKYRFGDRLQLHVEYDPDEWEEIMNCRIPKLTLQPILENAVLHGIDEKEGGRGTIRLSGRIQEDQIILEVQDDGVGMDPALLSEENLSEHSGKHYGLSNVRTRLWLFYEKNAELSCSSAPGLGTKITLRFPKKSDVEDTDG